ncbi:MAG: threonine--tRNA ligase, partial [Pseudomonadota bacterium]|nr:threonine--tRNA ligase [Pseudomonadota bacterium]
NQGLKSYRDLPVKISEFGLVHRNEPSGTLHGLMRARQFVQDDAHIFCTEEQLENEIKKLIELTIYIYKEFGFKDIDVAFSTRPENKVGDDKLWDKSEKILKQVLDKTTKNYQTHPGEGAFYGPKIEFTLTDSLDRIWQCGTIQLDFSMPTLLGATYVAEDGSKIAPVMIHRAILGSLERFIGILIEHHAGVLPFWLAPTQVVIATITDKHAEYAKELDRRLMMDNYRSEVDLRNEKIGYKIREHVVLKVPYVVIIGDKEVSSQTLSIRTYDGDEINSINYEEFIKVLGKNNLNKN